MELAILDPFGDYERAGYLRNIYQEKDLTIVAHLEAIAFEDHIHEAIQLLRRSPHINYSHLCETHRLLFGDVYPWAGQDRSENARNIAIGRAGYKTLFAHPRDVQRAADFALQKARDAMRFRKHPGEVFDYLAHAHPFLEGNGRTILTVFANLCRRADFYIEWESIEKGAFLKALTEDLLSPGTKMDELLLPYVRTGTLSIRKAAVQLKFKFHT